MASRVIELVRRRQRLLVMVVVAALVSCGGPRLAPTPAPRAPTHTRPPTGQATPPSTKASSEATPCGDGQLVVGDLSGIDRAWQSGLSVATAKAAEWQPDATLTALQVSCRLFEAGFQWQATFYSRNAQAFFSSDTGEVDPAGVKADTVPMISGDSLSFDLLHRALAASGFDDRTSISPSTGIEVRRNTATAPFGPPDAPKDVILYHVAIERLGEVKDVFVDGDDGSVYRYLA